uniref:LAGLIDADG homing endonuclease n=1 Tax=Panagrolaimus superbus TaxID=310955 RepID=A0A914YNQ9_9BILA
MPSLTSVVIRYTNPKLKKKEAELIHRPNDLGSPENLGKKLNIFYTKITNSGGIMMKKSEMNKFIDIFVNASANEYLLQLTPQQMKGFIKKFMNVLTQKSNKYRNPVGCILADWVLRLRPKFYARNKIDIFHEIPIAESLRKIPKSKKIFKKVFIVLGIFF